ncbi:uncharacterized protein [Onthophagus taurus]|uniref:uncharacterized protein n=1 Tax=Onthophagus taurus TaxID=166361 RepID=UPI000C1FF766|nr:uncharacterized protein LOC111427285 [Onthophagus taurus]
MVKSNDRGLTEQLEKEFRYFKIYDNYRPDYHKSAVTSKFYSKYEALDLSLANEELVSTIKKYRDKGPKDKYDWYPTENQSYGWFNTPFVPINKMDERYYHVKVESDFVHHALLLAKDKSMKLEKFAGIPFKLQ